MSDNFQRILIVDDFELMRTMLKNALVDLGIKNVTDAVDGLDAKSKLEESLSTDQPYQIIFCDWNMPNMTGYDLLQFVRSSTEFKDIPFVMVTAESEKEFVIKALSSGATDYIVKPVSAETVRKKLETIKKKLEL